MASSSSPPIQTPKRLRRPSYDQPRVPHGELLVDEILTRLPIAAAVRFRAVCREWHAALTSDHFIRAHHARTTAVMAARNLEMLFLAPCSGAGGHHRATSFNACSIHDGAAAARELLTVADLSAEHAVFSPTPCRGLTLVFDGRSSEYHVINLSTGEHVVLPPATAAEARLEERPFIDGRLNIYATWSYLPPFTPWIPFELSTTGIGFDTTTGEHKVVRLFKNLNGEYACEVCNPRGLTTGWRRCVGRLPPCVASLIPALPPVFVDDGYLYWLLDHQPTTTVTTHRILSFSMATEQFGWVYVPPRLSSRICHLANLDGFLCAVVDNHLFGGVYGLFTWSGRLSPSWSMRCCINLKTLHPQQVSDELANELVIVPLCTSAGGNKILVATGCHKVFACDIERNAVERVFRMQDFVDVPDCYLHAPLLLRVGLHDDQRSKGAARRLNRILSFSMATEQFGWVYVPPRLSHRICYLANLDGFLCAVFDNHIFAGVYGLFTWGGRLSPSWSVRCCINLKSLQPQQVSGELAKERVIVPLCSADGGNKILLATGRHKVFAYDIQRDTVERVFRMQDFVDVPSYYLKSPLLLSVGLHDAQRSPVSS
uniref:F-box domain-containing protein n=1 Tax=Leersia perrieri TaxID=77586 RepID=A0A0D9XGU9_9ORYZ